MKIIIIFLFFSLIQLYYSQEIVRKGVRELQKKEFERDINLDDKTNVSNKQNILSIQKSTSTLTKKVFGLLPYWEQRSETYNNQYDLLRQP